MKEPALMFIFHKTEIKLQKGNVAHYFFNKDEFSVQDFDTVLKNYSLTHYPVLTIEASL